MKNVQSNPAREPATGAVANSQRQLASDDVVGRCDPPLGTVDARRTKHETQSKDVVILVLTLVVLCLIGLIYLKLLRVERLLDSAI